MSRPLILVSSEIERIAAFPDGALDGVDLALCGVGLVDAGIGAARMIDRYVPTMVIFAGTCGAHRGSGLEIGDMVLVAEASLGSGDVVRREMRIPALLPSTIEVDSAVNDRLDGSIERDRPLQRVRCSCTLGVTESDSLAAMLADESGAQVENLEIFPVLRAAGDRPAAALVGVTNIVGAGGGIDWRMNYERVMGEIGRMLRSAIERGGGHFSAIEHTKESL